MREIYDGTRKYPYPNPMVLGTAAIGHVAALGPDAVSLEVGQLVYVDSLVRGRDDPTKAFLGGIHEGTTPGSRKLMHGEWRDWTYAEYTKVPLENCHALNAERLLGEPGDGGMGYTAEQLNYMSMLLVPYGGLKDIGLQAGETVIISPATGQFGGAAVMVAIAMGARVIAMGRNESVLERLQALFAQRLQTVRITGDMEKDTESLKKFGTIDAFLDISPPAAAKSTHIKSGILALRHGGRISLMGGIHGDIAIPHSRVMHWNLQLKGKWMCERQDIVDLIKMIEVGVLRLDENAGVKVMGKFVLQEWQDAFSCAAANASVGMIAVINP